MYAQMYPQNIALNTSKMIMPHTHAHSLLKIFSSKNIMEIWPMFTRRERVNKAMVVFDGVSPACQIESPKMWPVIFSRDGNTAMQKSKVTGNARPIMLLPLWCYLKLRLINAIIDRCLTIRIKLSILNRPDASPNLSWTALSAASIWLCFLRWFETNLPRKCEFSAIIIGAYVWSVEIGRYCTIGQHCAQRMILYGLPRQSA